jgi:hypothetical protein
MLSGAEMSMALVFPSWLWERLVTVSKRRYELLRVMRANAYKKTTLKGCTKPLAASTEDVLVHVVGLSICNDLGVGEQAGVQVSLVSQGKVGSGHIGVALALVLRGVLGGVLRLLYLSWFKI